MSNLKALVTQLCISVFGDLDSSIVQSIIDLEISSTKELKEAYPDFVPLEHGTWGDDEEKASNEWFTKYGDLLVYS